MIGSVVGNYKIIEKIGEGGMGSVFKGVDVMLDREVAIKSLRPELARKPDLLARFRSEAVTLAKLNHPNIATLFSFFRSGDDFYMVMEFVDGPTLDDIIRDSKAMATARAVPLFCQALEGIEHAHNMGILHRDIKPANIMVSSQDVVKVTDFGIARVLGEAGMTRQGAVVGTIEYMSPERIQGQEIDRRSDIYALGVVLYEMLTGRGLFSATSEYDLMRAQVEQPPAPPREYEPGIPEAVEAVIMRSLAKKPQYRIPTAAEFQQALWAAIEPQGVAARGSRFTPVPPPRETPRLKETVVYERPEPAVSTPAPPPLAPRTRFVAEAGPPLDAPSPSPPVPSEQPSAPAAAVKPPSKPPAPVAPTHEATAAAPRPPAAASGERAVPQQAASPVIAAPTLGSIGTAEDDSRWKLYAGLAATIVLVFLLAWALMPGANEPEVPPVASDTPEVPGAVPDTPQPAAAGVGGADAGGSGSSPVAARPSIPQGTGKQGTIPRGTPAIGAGKSPGGEVGRQSPPRRKRPPAKVAAVPPKKAPPAPPIKQAPPPQALSPEEVAAAAERARQRLREQALKALEK